MRYVFALFLLVFQVPALAQAPQPVISPEVHTDSRVTFRFRAPNAKELFLAREGVQHVPMQRDEQGVWSVTIDPANCELGVAGRHFSGIIGAIS